MSDIRDTGRFLRDLSEENLREYQRVTQLSSFTKADNSCSQDSQY